MSNTRTECGYSNTNGWSAIFTANQEALANRLGSRVFVKEYNGVTYNIGDASYAINPAGISNTVQLKMTVTEGGWPDLPLTPPEWGSVKTTQPMTMAVANNKIYLCLIDSSNKLYIAMNDGTGWSKLNDISAQFNSLQLKQAVSIATMADNILVMTMVDQSTQLVYYSTSTDGLNWQTPTTVSETFKTEMSVNTAYYSVKGKVYLAAVDVNNKANIASYDGSSWTSFEQVFTNWLSGEVLQPMALAEFAGMLNLGILGKQSSNNNNIASADKQGFFQAQFDGTWDSQPTLRFKTFYNLHNTDFTIFLSATNNRLYASYVDDKGNYYIGGAKNDGTAWPSQPTPIFSSWKKQVNGAVPIVTFKNQLYLACFTEDGTPFLASQTSDLNWPNNGKKLSNIAATGQVATAVFNDVLYMAVENENKVGIVTSLDGFEWSEVNAPFTNWAKAANLKLHVFNNQLHLIITGTDNNIYSAILQSGKSWPDTPSQILSTSQTEQTVALSVFNSSNFFMAFVSCNSNSLGQIFISSYDTSNNIWGNAIRVLTSVTTNNAVCITEFKNSLYMALMDNDNIVNLAVSSDGTNWPKNGSAIMSSWKTELNPTMEVFENMLFVGGVGSNNELYLANSIDGLTWPDSPTQFLTSANTTLPITLCAYSNLLYVSYIEGGSVHIISSGGLALVDINTEYLGAASVFQPYYVDYAQSTNPVVSCGNIDKVVPSNGFTFSCWIKTKSENKQTIFSLGGAGGIRFILGAYNGSTENNFLTLSWGNDTITSKIDTGKLNDGKWHHVAVKVAISGNDFLITFFKDGRDDSGGDTPYTWSGISQVGGTVLLGTVAANDMNAFKGQLTQAALWAKTITNQEVRLFMNSDLSQIIDANFLGYWSFSDRGSSKNLVGSLEEVIVSDVYFPQPFSAEFPETAVGSPYPNIGCGDLGSFDPTKGFTFATWINTSTNSEQTIMAINSSDGIRLTLGANNADSGEYNFLKLSWGSASVTESGATKIVADGSWHHIAVTVAQSGSNFVVVFYKDGIANNGNSLSAVNTQSGKLRLGTITDTDSDYFKGNMAETGVWVSALSTEDVQKAMMLNLLDLESESLVGYWTFNEGVNSKNLTGSKNNIIPVGILFPAKNAGIPIDAYFYLFDSTPNANKLLTKILIYIQGNNTPKLVQQLQSAVNSFATKTHSVEVHAATHNYAPLSCLFFNTITDKDDSTQSQILIEVMLNNSLPPTNATFSIIDFSKYATTNNMFVLCDYSFWSDIVIPNLALKLKNNADDFEVTDDQPPVLRLVEPKTFAPFNSGNFKLILNSMVAKVPNESSPPDEPQEIFDTTASVLSKYGKTELLGISLGVPVTALVEEKSTDNSSLSKLKETEPSSLFSKFIKSTKFNWTWKDTVAAIITLLLLTAVTVVGIIWCAHLVPSPIRVVVLTLISILYWAYFLYVITNVVLNKQQQLDKKSTNFGSSGLGKNIDRVLQIRSNATVSISLKAGIIALLVVFVLLIGAIVAAIIYYKFSSLCLTVMVALIIMILLSYILFLIIMFYIQQLQDYIKAAIDNGVKRDINLTGIGDYTLLGINAEKNSLMASGRIGPNEE